MNLLRYVLLLQFATTLAFAQTAQSIKPAIPPNDPEALVRNLYKEVVARHPVGIPYGANMKIFAPYLSKTLLHKIDLATTCGKDWYRQHPDPTMKPEMAWLEVGLFSGGDEKASPGNFQIESTQAEKDGSFRVNVRLMWRPPDGPGDWRVAVIVVREDGHFVVCDVIYLKDEHTSPLAPTEWRFSELLSQGCDGTRWVGYRDR